MTECAHQICSNPLPPLKRKKGSVGKPIGINVKICCNGRICENNLETGEIVIKGQSVISGYHFKNKKNSSNYYVDGFFKTGDLGLHLHKIL